MVAAPRLKKRQNVLPANIRGEKEFPGLLKVAAIYGPNASGKSALIQAMKVIPDLLRKLPTAELAGLPVSPFRFDKDLTSSPSKFELNFVEEQRRFTYEVALTKERIMEERLTTYEKGSDQLLYERVHKENQDVYRWGALEGGEELHEAWRRLTGPQALFLAQAVANSNEELRQLRTPFNWLFNITIVDEGMTRLKAVMQRLVATMPSLGEDVAKLLAEVDVPVSAIKSTVIERTSGKSPRFPHFRPLTEGELDRLTSVLNVEKVQTTLTHQTSLGTAEFDFSEESEGTQNLFGFALAWYLAKQPNKHRRDNLIVVDELDSSLHPKVVESLVQRHLSDDEFPSQLIFTTHDTHLMDTKLLRRDQIWLTERDPAGATQLRAVHDFEGREGEDVEKRYYEGRYRALPIVASS